LAVLGAFSLASLSAPDRCYGQPAETMTTTAPIDTTIAAGEADAQKPAKRGLAKYNEWDFGFTTFRIGYGFLVDFASYVQDDDSKQQVVLEMPDAGLRDFRLLFKGKFKTKRPITWTAGVMYDGATKDWHGRQTGIMVSFPEIYSHFFVGRTKEGYSLYKHMVGYDIWTIERSTFLDAFIPILADGIKWIGNVPQHGLIWQLGFYGDALSETEKFATYDHQIVARFIWLPVLTERKVLHLAVMGRDAKPDENKFQARSRPEAFLAPYYVDTGKFDSDHARTAGFEAYYRNGPLTVGGEYGWQTMDAPTVGDPMFHGGNVSAAWLVTGETRGYNAVSGYFNAISPTRTVFEGGLGAVELTMNLSYVDLDGGSLRGGKFWRVTPCLKWHLMDYMRVELGYGYGVLDRVDRKGTTHFFQGRLLTAL
jgi:phosphate-selective porin OprO/OprP